MESSEGLEWQAMKPTVLFSAGLVSMKSGRVGGELAEFSDGVACCAFVELSSRGDAALTALLGRLVSLEGDGGARSLPDDESRTSTG